MKERYYITTPIYYPSSRLTIGNAYTTVIADCLARWQRMQGKEVIFLTGTDEHGQKIERVAHSKGVSPQTYLDYMVEADVKDLWRLLNISYDRFIRTTDPEHERAVQAIFARLLAQDDIYLGEYEGLYCLPCESFWSESQLVGGCCPDCGRPVEPAQESCYFLRMSKYQARLIEYYESHPDFIKPASRMKEMLNNFILPGLEDLAVSRTSFKWGVPVLGHEEHVVYVWIDALSNYLTALGYPEPNSDFANFWPANLQLVGKDIIRFHIVIWPILLMALDLPLPEQVFGHGWLLLQGDKLSKSKSSKGNVVDPYALAEVVGVDAIRYFLLSEIQFGQDGNFSGEALLNRTNSDLANDLGNLLSRTVAMIIKYFPAGLPSYGEVGELEAELASVAQNCCQKVELAMAELDLSGALQEIWRYIRRLNKYIDETMPWALAKEAELRERLAAVLYNLADGLRRIAVLITAFMPTTAARMEEQLGIAREQHRGNEQAVAWPEAVAERLYPLHEQLTKAAVLFPRLEVEPALERLDELNEKRAAAAAAAEAEYYRNVL